MKAVAILILTFCSFVVFGQSSKAIEQDLLKQYKIISYWYSFNTNNDSISKYDSLEKANENFEKTLIRYTSQYGETITFDFAGIKKEGLNIVTSDDTLFRIYSWDTWTGGTMHVFRNVYQYKINGKVFSKSIPDSNAESYPGTWYSKIYSITSQRKKIYLCINHAIFSTKDIYQGIKFFSLSTNSLNDSIKLIKTQDGIKNSIGFEFDFFSVVKAKERPVRLIFYDKSKKTIKIPVILENGEVTKKIISYRFTGQYFERER